MTGQCIGFVQVNVGKQHLNLEGIAENLNGLNIIEDNEILVYLQMNSIL
jgi:hypothetical protein